VELLISAGQVLTGPSGQRIPDGAVLIRDRVLVAVAGRAEVEAQASADAVSVSFPAGTVLPGLVNCHVHLAFDAGPDPAAAVQAADDTTLLLGMAGRALELLDCGVTTARDLGDRGGLAMRLRDAIAGGLLPGPRILAAGAPLTVPGGHCWYLGGEVDGEQSIREMVRRNARDGADLIKVMVSGGQTTPGGAAMWESQFGADEVRVVVDEAHREGLRVAAHAHGTEGIAAAVAAGVNTVEHCTFLADGGVFRPSEDVAEQLAGAGIHVCPTTSPNWRRLAQFIGPERAEQLQGRLRWLDDRGVRLVFGTDAGLPGSVFGDVVGSLGLYRHLGFPAERIVEMATVDAAAALGLADHLGRLGPGMSADVVVVDGDPLVDLDALGRVRLVVARGRAHVPASAALRAGGSGTDR
jgi:imidazolonepropionase-like amidohydrolase